MAKKLKYYFNPHDLVYVMHRPKNWEQLLKAGGIFAATFLAVLVSYSVFIYQAKNPGEKKLRQQLQLYKMQVERMNGQLADMHTKLSDLESRDNEIYRVIFEADPMPHAPAIGGADKYKYAELIADGAFIVETDKKLDELFSRMGLMEQSYAELSKLAKQKQQYLASLPAIQPISNKNLKQIASGFGHRLHPVYKQMQMHTGLDFTAATGTPIYATGDGIVEGKDPNGSGYGDHTVINHGFGYRTLYGHMSKVLVKPGQKVKRGQIIGKVGSTGISTAPHLHYEVIKSGKKIDPIHYFHNDLNAQEYAQLIDLANKSKQSFD